MAPQKNRLKRHVNSFDITDKTAIELGFAYLRSDEPYQNYHVCDDPGVEPALHWEVFLLDNGPVEAFISRQTDHNGQVADKIKLSLQAAQVWPPFDFYERIAKDQAGVVKRVG